MLQNEISDLIGQEKVNKYDCPVLNKRLCFLGEHELSTHFQLPHALHHMDQDACKEKKINIF